jgi:acyl-CoA thioesterase I
MIEFDMGGYLFRRRSIFSCLMVAALAFTWSMQGATAKPSERPLLVLGDSLSAEYGLKRGTGWVALLEQRLKSSNRSLGVINASISGETTSGGLSRLKALLDQHQPAVLVVELGGNDALRGLPLNSTESNLNQITKMGLASGARVLIVGMQVPPNYGADYALRFQSIFKSVAQSNKVSLVAFFLKGVADIPEPTRFFQADRIHPKEEAQSIMLENVWPEIKKLLP